MLNIYRPFMTLLILSVFSFLFACSEQQAVSEPEAVDEAFTQELQASLDQQLVELTQQQTETAEQSQTASLEELAEIDRETLIDETAEQGSEQVKQDADKIIKILEDIAADNE